MRLSSDQNPSFGSCYIAVFSLVTDKTSAHEWDVLQKQWYGFWKSSEIRCSRFRLPNVSSTQDSFCSKLNSVFFKPKLTYCLSVTSSCLKLLGNLTENCQKPQRMCITVHYILKITAPFSCKRHIQETPAASPMAVQHIGNTLMNLCQASLW